jgi:hypothetical protein
MSSESSARSDINFYFDTASPPSELVATLDPRATRDLVEIVLAGAGLPRYLPTHLEG